MRAHTQTPYNTDSLWETLRALNRPGRARTVRQRQPRGVRGVRDARGAGGGGLEGEVLRDLARLERVRDNLPRDELSRQFPSFLIFPSVLLLYGGCMVV
jgi:hypothetical protein